MPIALGGKRAIAAPDMPRGFDNEDSPFYIPEPLRPHWFESLEETKAQDVVSVAHSIGWQELNRAACMARGIDFTKPLDANSSRREQLNRGHLLNEAAVEANTGLQKHISQNFERLMKEARHRITLEVAARLAAANRDRMQKLEARTKGYTCPMCGESDPRKHGGVDTRRVENTTVFRTLTSLQSCVLCFEEARATLRELRSAQVTASGKTRGDVIRKWAQGVVGNVS